MLSNLATRITMAAIGGRGEIKAFRITNWPIRAQERQSLCVNTTLNTKLVEGGDYTQQLEDSLVRQPNIINSICKFSH